MTEVHGGAKYSSRSTVLSPVSGARYHGAMLKRLLSGAAAVAVLANAAGCASGSTSGPVVVAVPPAPLPSVETRHGWVLRLENQRQLREADASGSTPVVGTRAPGVFSPALHADLAELVTDTDASVRRRAAIALGRIKDRAGFEWLTARLQQDPEPEVRAAAAFALGVLADARAVEPLVSALGDAGPVVKARAIEALGLLADKSSAPAVVRAAAGCGAVLAPIEPDVEPTPTPEITMCRLALFALVRLQSYEGIESVALDAQGRPVSRWWPVAYALQRINDRRALPALRTLAAVPSVYTAGFALRGLAAHKDPSALDLARGLASQKGADVKARVAAVRLLSAAGVRGDAKILLGILGDVAPGSPLGLEAIAVLGALADPTAFDVLVDLFGESSPAVRSAALAAAAQVDPERFLLVLSGLGRDRDWSVRASLAGVLATFPAATVSPALNDLVSDDDSRVRSAGLEALAKIKASDLSNRLFAALDEPDFVVRGTAARLIGETKPAGGVARLVSAWTRAASDTAYGARGAVLDALAAYGGDEALRTLEAALSDREWPIRTKAAGLLAGLGQTTAGPARPAILRQPAAFFESESFLRPRYSPHALIDTRYGTIEVQLDVVNAPLTVATFVELTRGGFFNGIKVHRLVPTFVIQAGDPRGDGEGGPGFTLRDELSSVPYVRGTVGMALDWADTGGSQWFITLSPQPHLDAKYTVFGRVVNGWDVLDQVTRWDVIERVRIWDGVELR